MGIDANHYSHRLRCFRLCSFWSGQTIAYLHVPLLSYIILGVW